MPGPRQTHPAAACGELTLEVSADGTSVLARDATFSVPLELEFEREPSHRAIVAERGPDSVALVRRAFVLAPGARLALRVRAGGRHSETAGAAPRVPATRLAISVHDRELDGNVARLLRAAAARPGRLSVALALGSFAAAREELQVRTAPAGCAAPGALGHWRPGASGVFGSGAPSGGAALCRDLVEYLAWTGDAALVGELWPRACAAIALLLRARPGDVARSDLQAAAWLAALAGEHAVERACAALAATAGGAADSEAPPRGDGRPLAWHLRPLHPEEAALPMLLRSVLGLRVRASGPELALEPALPPDLPHVSFAGLRIREHEVAGDLSVDPVRGTFAATLLAAPRADGVGPLDLEIAPVLPRAAAGVVATLDGASVACGQEPWAGGVRGRVRCRIAGAAELLFGPG